MTETGRRLRVVTWNIHGGVGRDGRRDARRVAEHLAALRPDVAALQEVDSRHDRHSDPDMFELLRRQVGDHGLHAPTLGNDRGHYGQLLASRWPLAETTVHDISVAGREPRRVLDARIAAGRTSIRVLAAHLGLAARERRVQLVRLRAIVEAGDRRLPIVILGDFNDWRRRGHTHRSLSGIAHAGTGHATFPSVLPVFPLDRIYWHPEPSTVRTWIARDSRHASDHLAVAAELAFG